MRYFGCNGSTITREQYESEEITFTAGAATINALTVNSLLRMTLTENSTMTIENDLKDFVINLIIDMTGGPWTLEIVGETVTADLVPSVAAGERDYWTSISDGTNRDWHQGGLADVVA